MVLSPVRLALLLPLAAALAACGGTADSPSSALDRSPAGASALKHTAAVAPAPAPAPGYAVLANAAATCTSGAIAGDVGTFLAPPARAITLTSCPVTGASNVGTAGAVQAYDSFLNTYAALAPQPLDVCTALTGTLDGVTLAPGTYCFPAAATLTGVLTLRGPANGTWLFRIGSGVPPTGALTGTNFSVVMAGGAQACNVTWWVAEAATVTMTGTSFQGSILAGAAITLTGGTFLGNVWSKADVTVTGTSITGCASVVIGGGGGGGGCEDGDDDGEGDCDKDHDKCDQGHGNGSEDCDPGDSDHHNSSNDEGDGHRGHQDHHGQQDHHGH